MRFAKQCAHSALIAFSAYAVLLLIAFYGQWSI